MCIFCTIYANTQQTFRIKSLRDDTIHRRYRIQSALHGTATLCTIQAISLVVLYLVAQQRVRLRWCDERFVSLQRIVLHRLHSGSFATHNEDTIFVVGEHIVHFAFQRVDAHDTAYKHLARTTCIGAITRHQIEQRCICHQQQQHPKNKRYNCYSYCRKHRR